jgi:hypothetical protein
MFLIAAFLHISSADTRWRSPVDDPFDATNVVLAPSRGAFHSARQP